MSATVLERDMLKTAVPERDMSVTTFLNQNQHRPQIPQRRAMQCHPWTAVWWGPHAALVWLHFWQGPTSVGGLAEAHESVVARVRAGELPAQGADDPAPTSLIRGALIAGGALARDAEGGTAR